MWPVVIGQFSHSVMVVLSIWYQETGAQFQLVATPRGVRYRERNQRIALIRLKTESANSTSFHRNFLYIYIYIYHTIYMHIYSIYVNINIYFKESCIYFCQ